MKVRFILSNSIYNCSLKIKDLQGAQEHLINAAIGEDETAYLDVEVCGESLELTVIPEVVELKSTMDEIEVKSFGDKLAKKFIAATVSFAENAILRVGCKYSVNNITDGSIICIDLQAYAYGTVDKLDLLGLHPMVYAFYEVSFGGERLEVTEAFGTNRSQVISFARKLSLFDFSLGIIVTYPVQVSRIKRLTKDKKVFKTLYKFHHLSPEKRQKYLDSFD